jgi:large subunit ribosomal protein L30e
MADLENNIRLAVDSGKVALGINKVANTIESNVAKLVVVASKGKGGSVEDIKHLSKVANVRLLTYDGTSMELGTVCGKPYSVSALAVIEPGNSKILDTQ